MAIRKIELDEDANRILDSMAKVYGGNASLVISELLRAHETIESFLDELESSHGEEFLPRQVESQKKVTSS